MLRFYICIAALVSLLTAPTVAQTLQWIKGGSLGSWRLIDNFSVLQDRGHLATGEEYGVIRISSLRTGQLLHVISAQDTMYYGFQYVRQQEAVVVAHWEEHNTWKSKIDVYDTDTYTLKRELQGTGEFWQYLPSHLAFSPDGKTLAIATWQEDRTSIMVLDYAQGTEKKLLLCNMEVQDMLFWDADTLLVAEGQELKLIDMQSGTVTRAIPVLQNAPDATSPIQTAVVSADKRYVAVSQKNSPRIEVYESGSGKFLWTANGADINDDLVFIAPMNVIAVPDPNGVKLLDVLTGAVKKNIVSSIAWPSTVLYDEQEQQVVIGSRDGDAEVRDVQTGELYHTVSLLTGYPNDLAFFDDQPYFAVLAGGILRVCDLEQGNLVSQSTLGETSCFAIHLELNIVAFENKDDHSIQLATLQPFSRLTTLKGHKGNILDIEFSPDGSSLVSTSEDGTTIVWDVASRQQKRTFTGRTLGNNTLAFTRDGTTLYVATQEREVYVYRIAQDELGTIPLDDTGVALAITPNSPTIAVATLWGNIIFYDVSTGEKTGELSPEQGRVHSMAFLHDGRYILVAGEGNSVVLWDVNNSTEVRRYTYGPASSRYNNGITCMAVSADERYLLVATHDVSVALWDISNLTSVAHNEDQDVLRLSCAMAEPGVLTATLSTDKTAVVTYSMYNSRGQLVRTVPAQYIYAQQQPVESSQDIPVSRLVSGLYFLRAEIDDRVLVCPFMLSR